MSCVWYCADVWCMVLGCCIVSGAVWCVESGVVMLLVVVVWCSLISDAKMLYVVLCLVM